jgi:predicted cupin superfamily sugar epimerase
MSPPNIIALLRLEKHPKEGGYFRETNRSPQQFFPNRYAGPRSVGTAIYYLITRESFSALHRLPGDEIFHHYLGEAVEMLLLHPSGESEIVRLGKDIAAGERPQVVVPGGTWQGSKLATGGEFALLGCTMSPGFDYADYQHGDRAQFIAQFPAEAERIISLTPET